MKYFVLGLSILGSASSVMAQDVCSYWQGDDTNIINGDYCNGALSSACSSSGDICLCKDGQTEDQCHINLCSAATNLGPNGCEVEFANICHYVDGVCVPVDSGADPVADQGDVVDTGPCSDPNVTPAAYINAQCCGC